MPDPPADLQPLPLPEPEPELEPIASLPSDFQHNQKPLLKLSLDRSEQDPAVPDVNEPEETWPSISDKLILEPPQSSILLNNESASAEAWLTIDQPVAAQKDESSLSSESSSVEPEVSKSKSANLEQTKSPLGELRFNDD